MQHGTWRKKLQAQECGQSYVLYPYWRDGNAGAHLEKTRGARIRSRFRSINAHDEQKILKFAFTILISSWQCNYSRMRLQFYRLENSARTTDFPMSGSSVKKPRLTKAEKTMKRKADNCVPIVVPWLSTNSEAIRPLHRHRRTRQVHLQVQY